jgi:hypothetical protein
MDNTILIKKIIDGELTLTRAEWLTIPSEKAMEFSAMLYAAQIALIAAGSYNSEVYNRLHSVAEAITPK